MKLTLCAATFAAIAILHVAGSDLPTGKLGHPLGTYLTIAGVTPVPHEMKDEDNALLVDMVNGAKLTPPVAIALEDAPSLPPGTPCLLRGYETGRMIGIPDDVGEKEQLPAPQAMWQFYRTFIVTSVVEPKEFAVPRQDLNRASPEKEARDAAAWQRALKLRDQYFLQQIERIGCTGERLERVRVALTARAESREAAREDRLADRISLKEVARRAAQDQDKFNATLRQILTPDELAQVDEGAAHLEAVIEMHREPRPADDRTNRLP